MLNLMFLVPRNKEKNIEFFWGVGRQILEKIPLQFSRNRETTILSFICLMFKSTQGVSEKMIK